MFTQRLHFWHAFSYDILDQHKLWYFDLKSHKRTPEVTGGQREVQIEKYTQGLHFGMLTHIISLNNINYDILTSKSIRCHQRSVEVK